MLKKIQNNKIKIYLVLVIVLFVLILYFSLKDNYKEIIEILLHADIVYLLLGVLCVFISKYFVGVTLYDLAKKENKKTRFSKMMNIALIYPFFAGITPGAIGGEGFEIFYLKQTGISYGKSSNITMQKFILYEISLIIVNVMAVIINLFTNVVHHNSLITLLVIINFIVNGVGLGLLFLLVYNKKVNHFVMNKGMMFLHKIRIIKDINKSKKKLDDYLDNFDDGVENLKKDKKLFMKLVVVNVLSLLFYMIAAYPIASSLGINSVNIVNTFVLLVYARMIGFLLVTPGNSGGAEYSFVYLFTGLLLEEDLVAYMLIWRFVTYYIPLIFGGVLAIVWGKGDKK